MSKTVDETLDISKVDDLGMNDEFNINSVTPPAEPSVESKKEPKQRGSGIGEYAKALIREGHDNATVLNLVQERFPDAKTSQASINWYRNKLRVDGEVIPTARDLAAKDKPSKEEVAAAKKAAAEAKAANRAAAKAARTTITETPMEGAPDPLA